MKSAILHADPAEDVTRKWNPEQVGIALTIGGVAGVITRISAGAVIDRAHRKLLLVLDGLIMLALLFPFSNAAMLPLLGQMPETLAQGNQ